MWRIWGMQVTAALRDMGNTGRSGLLLWGTCRGTEKSGLQWRTLGIQEIKASLKDMGIYRSQVLTEAPSYVGAEQGPRSRSPDNHGPDNTEEPSVESEEKERQLWWKLGYEQLTVRRLSQESVHLIHNSYILGFYLGPGNAIGAGLLPILVELPVGVEACVLECYRG